jgi:hypothetical protein
VEGRPETADVKIDQTRWSWNAADGRAETQTRSEGRKCHADSPTPMLNCSDFGIRMQRNAICVTSSLKNRLSSTIPSDSQTPVRSHLGRLDSPTQKTARRNLHTLIRFKTERRCGRVPNLRTHENGRRIRRHTHRQRERIRHSS